MENPEQQYDGEQYQEPELEEGFAAFLQHQLQRTPWWLISLVFHSIIGFIATLIVVVNTQEQPPISPEAFEFDNIAEVREVKPEPKRDIFKETKPVKHEEKTIEDPVVKEATVSDHHETANDEAFAMAKGMEEAATDSPFTGKFDSSFIGVGGNAGGKFGTRFGGRENLLKEGGGSLITEGAVEAGLEWLKRHQSEDGSWDADGFAHQCGKDSDFPGSCDGPGYSEYDPSVTGLALLCFLGAGHTSTTGKYREQVKKAIDFLHSIQDQEGCFGSQTFANHMYNHSIATLAISEAYALSNHNPIMKISAQKAIDFLLKVQTPDMGWGYNRNSNNDDTSIMGWCVMALRNARVAGLKVPERSFSDAKAFLNSVTASDYRTGYRKKSGEIEFETAIMRSRYLFSVAKEHRNSLMAGQISDDLQRIFRSHNFALSYMTITQKNYNEIATALGSSERQTENLGWLIHDRENNREYHLKEKDQIDVYLIEEKFAASEAMTAVAMNARVFMETERNNSHLIGAAERLSQHLPVWGNDKEGYSLINYYYWYHATLAMFQMEDGYWRTWNDRIKEIFVTHQKKEGCENGSWPSIGKRCKVGGRVYATALSVLSLEIYYRYDKILN